MTSNKPKLDITTEQTIYNGLSEPRFDGMFYNNSTAAAVVNQDTSFDKVNEAFCKATGYSREELTGMKWTQLIPEDIKPFLLEKNEKRAEDPMSFSDDYEITFYNKHGEKHYAQMAVTFLPLLKKRLLGFLVTTNQKRTLQIIEEKSELLLKEVSLKDIEITNYLLKLANNNKLGEQICLKLKRIGDLLTDENKALLPDINEIIRDVEFYHKSSFWETLDEHFIRTHPEFAKNLLVKHPTITPAEIKLATLLSLQLSTKDIANVMIQGYDSIRVSRTRLRKKLGLANGDNLQAYLMSLFNK